ncbi:two-component sensor histidine kinase [Paenibacillus sp. L3-i20]|nr:two-component sensor histidine kinase [Paenibacillus sp. L3-i20]
MLLATIYVGQTFFFEKYYANHKLNQIQTKMKTFETDYLNSDGPQAVQKLERAFYLENNAWITTLDQHGSLLNAPDFYLKAQLYHKLHEDIENKKPLDTITIPLYNFMSIEEAIEKKTTLEKGVDISIIKLIKDSVEIPVQFELRTENNLLRYVYEGIDPIEESDLKFKYMKNEISIRHGDITSIQIPDQNAASGYIYSNTLFMKKIKEFQAQLLANERGPEIDLLRSIDFVENNVKYNLIIDQIEHKDGSKGYIISMTSMQPVDEAVQMLKDYYGYLVLFAMLLIVLAAFYYSKKIAKPLLQINRTTQKIASLDFSERISISSKDEIGDLSQNINLLSNTLHSYILQLRQDIEKEKQLENTRKEFISDVSHELKTPLSIMKSCISILKDGVASHKKEHYFEAMEKEVDKMDILIVDMLDLAKFESGTYKMEMDEFYIDKVIEYICDQLSPSIRQKELHIHKSLLPVEVIANQHRIEQVITNFLTNAIRYTPLQNDIFVSTIEENDVIKVKVENKGAHISAEQLDKVWDRFYRGDISRHRYEGSTGIGLAISKNILELHQVQYGVYNTVDGVVFYFYLNKKG